MNGMKRYNQPVDIIIQQTTAKPGAKGIAYAGAAKTIEKQLEAAGIPVHSVRRAAVISSASSKSKQKTAIPENAYTKTKINDTEVNPWDVAHIARTALNNPHTLAGKLTRKREKQTPSRLETEIMISIMIKIGHRIKIQYGT